MSDEKLAKMLLDTMTHNNILKDGIEDIKNEIDLTYQWFEEHNYGYDITSIRAYVDKLKERIEPNEKTSFYSFGKKNGGIV